MFERRCHLLGWLLFVASALGFLASAWRQRDPAALAASVLFLVGCLVFLLPLLRSPR